MAYHRSSQLLLQDPVVGIGGKRDRFCVAFEAEVERSGSWDSLHFQHQTDRKV